MGITKAPGPRYVNDLPGGRNVWEFNAQKNTIFCKACIYDVDYSASNVKYRLKSHYESGGHLHKVELRKKQQLLATSMEGENAFGKDLVKTLVSSGKPISMVECEHFKGFIERWTGKQVPSRTSLTRNYMEAVFNSTYGNVIEKFKNCKFALTIDEARDVCGRSVAGVLVNNLDNNEKPALIEVIELDVTNHRTIIQLVTKVLHLLCPDGDYARFKMFVTDGASYMLKAGSILKKSYDILHVTCVAHALHRLSEFVRSKHQFLDIFVSWMKKVLLKSSHRKTLYKEITELPLPPQPVVTRWGTWILTVVFYSENFEKMKDFIHGIENDDTDVVLKLKTLLSENEEVLAAQLLIVNVNFGFLPSSIEALQKRQSLGEAVKILERVIEKVTSNIYKHRLDFILSKNPDLKVLLNFGAVINGDVFSLDVTPETALTFVHSPIVSAEIDCKC